MNATQQRDLPTGHGDGTEGPDAPVTPVPEPPGYPAVPELPDDAAPAEDDDGGPSPD